MPIRPLTEAEQQRLLTREEVEALPSGTTLCIKWAGGNGPWAYVLGRTATGLLTLTTPGGAVLLFEPVYVADIGHKRWHHRCFVP